MLNAKLESGEIDPHVAEHKSWTPDQLERVKAAAENRAKQQVPAHDDEPVALKTDSEPHKAN